MKPRRANIRANDPRIRVWNTQPVRTGDYVVYWCQANRRADDNVALELAITRANSLNIPVVVYESIRPDYPYASDRFHTFVLECARDNARSLEARGIPHAFFLPKTVEEAKGIFAEVTARAALIVSDEHPGFVYPAQNEAAARRAPSAFVTVDDCAIAPLALIPAHEPQARTIRPKLLALLDQWLAPVVPIEPKVTNARIDWPFEPVDLEGDLGELVAACDIDHDVAPVADRPGGHGEALARLDAFLGKRGKKYDAIRDDAPADATSGLSPYLHFGAISARLCALRARESLNGRALEAFIEQLVVRRGLAFNHAARDRRHALYASVPSWARESLKKHEKDRRPEATTPSRLERALSDDDVWNAAQRELVLRGRIHNVMRMYWGKRLLTLMKRPKSAFDFATRMMDKYALDGRDPNTYAGVAWCFGLHDRPFPERKIYGNVRPMGLGALKKRFAIDDYVASVPAQLQKR